jgi:hypothetical protein
VEFVWSSCGVRVEFVWVWLLTNCWRWRAVTCDVDGRVSAFPPPDTIADPMADNRLWTVETGSFPIMLGAAKSSKATGARDSLLLPGVDGQLRVLDAQGQLRLNLTVSPSSPPASSARGAAVYCADAGYDSQGRGRIIAGGVDGSVHTFDWAGNRLGSLRMSRNHGSSGSIVRRVVVGCAAMYVSVIVMAQSTFDAELPPCLLCPHLRSNFDGTSGDEVAVFYNEGGFSGKGFFTMLDLETLGPAAYWNGSAAQDDVVQGLGERTGPRSRDKTAALN